MIWPRWTRAHLAALRGRGFAYGMLFGLTGQTVQVALTVAWSGTSKIRMALKVSVPHLHYIASNEFLQRSSTMTGLAFSRSTAPTVTYNARPSGHY